MTGGMKLNLVGNSKGPVISVKKKDILLKTVLNELTIHKEMVINIKEKVLLVVLSAQILAEAVNSRFTCEIAGKQKL